MPRELTERGEDRKSQLLAHAATLFETRGYADTRVTDIAAAAGVAKGLLYWYFPSKEGLLAELIDDVQSRLRHLQGDALEGIDDALERIYVGTFVTVRFVAEQFHLYGVLAAAAAGQTDAPLARSIARHATDTTAVLEEGQRQGVVRTNESAELLAYSISALVNELVRFRELGLVTGSIDSLAGLAARSAVHVVAADAAAATRGLVAWGAAPPVSPGPAVASEPP
ncbi:MAG: TetR/AcrR family transcriptional regulator [Actinobacteria bacterium]|nr:TetR/AcrR family transcriptional regulator [Actinomycetota bacterium]